MKIASILSASVLVSLGLTPASAAEPVKMGKGAHTYETVPGWGRLPDNKFFSNTHGEARVDKAGNLYFNSDGKEGVLVYSPEGKIVRTLGKELSGVHGMQIREENGEEFIYAAHAGRHHVLKTKLDGTVVWKLGYPKESGRYADDRQFRPTGVAVADDGRLYVADGYGKSWVHIYTKDRRYVRSFGGKGTEPGQFQTPHGISIDKRSGRELLLISDRENDRIQHFTMDGRFISITMKGLRKPCCVSIHGDSVAIAELRGRVTVLDGANKIAAQLGDNPDQKMWMKNGAKPEEWKEGVFIAPHGVTFDADGNLYVLGWNQFARISKLRRVGK